MKPILIALLLLVTVNSFAQNGWSITAAPAFRSRVDDVFMVNTKTGYAVSGDGRIVKTTNGGNNWLELLRDSSIYCRSVEFVNEQKGFVGGFLSGYPGAKPILRRTDDGGQTWTNLTSLLHPRARKGICGMSAPDTNTIYGCGNWFEDSSYIIKSTDGGNTWQFIDMSDYASSLIDIHFISKDTGFATGSSLLPLKTAIILYTTNGGQSWTVPFRNNIGSEYCWKIQQLNPRIFFASIEDNGPVNGSRILKSMDGGKTWLLRNVSNVNENIEGIGFIDSLKGWTGGYGNTYTSTDGGLNWTIASGICPSMNRVFKVNDTLLFASGREIWKYRRNVDEVPPPPPPPPPPGAEINAFIKVFPNPANKTVTVNFALYKPSRVLVILLDEGGRQLKTLINADKDRGDYRIPLDTHVLPAGVYYLVLRTHEEKLTTKLVVAH
jgi:photosystem II stability/assembly factor-like uncharacterized protein